MDYTRGLKNRLHQAGGGGASTVYLEAACFRSLILPDLCLSISTSDTLALRSNGCGADGERAPGEYGQRDE